MKFLQCDGAGWWPLAGLVPTHRVSMEPPCYTWYLRRASTNLGWHQFLSSSIGDEFNACFDNKVPFLYNSMLSIVMFFVKLHGTYITIFTLLIVTHIHIAFCSRNLTWRDMQHLVVRTSSNAKLNSDDFVVNAVGRKVSHRFGYGLLDAFALVDLARRWRTVPPQHVCIQAPEAQGRCVAMCGNDISLITGISFYLSVNFSFNVKCSALSKESYDQNTVQQSCNGYPVLT